MVSLHESECPYDLFSAAAFDFPVLSLCLCINCALTFSLSLSPVGMLMCNRRFFLIFKLWINQIGKVHNEKAMKREVCASGDASVFPLKTLL